MANWTYEPQKADAAYIPMLKNAISITRFLLHPAPLTQWPAIAARISQLMIGWMPSMFLIATGCIVLSISVGLRAPGMLGGTLSLLLTSAWGMIMLLVMGASIGQSMTQVSRLTLRGVTRARFLFPYASAAWHFAFVVCIVTFIFDGFLDAIGQNGFAPLTWTFCRGSVKIGGWAFLGFSALGSFAALLRWKWPTGRPSECVAFFFGMICLGGASMAAEACWNAPQWNGYRLGLLILSILGFAYFALCGTHVILAWQRADKRLASW